MPHSTHRITLAFLDQQLELEASPDETILNVARQHNIPIRRECEVGLCGSCKALRLSGEVYLYEDEPEGLTSHERDQGAILTCQAHALTDVVLNFDYAMAEAVEEAMTFEARISHLEWLAPSVVRIDLTPEASAPAFTFKAGQYANIIVPEAGCERAYSFASAPGSTDMLSFLIRVLPAGRMSDFLRSRAQVGQVLQLNAPHGVFFLRDGTAPLLFVAGGTGLGPFISMLQHLVDTNDTQRKVTLLYGVNRADEDMVPLSLLEAFRSRLSHFEFKVAAVDSCGSPGVSDGFVTGLLSEAMLDEGKAEAYLCGPPAMIESGVNWLVSHDLPDSQIHFERFTPSG